MQQVKMIITDMDGTLFTDDKRVTKTTIQALKDTKDRGYIIGIATGRAKFLAEKNVIDYGLKDVIDVIIGMNGSQIANYKNNTYTEGKKVSNNQIKVIVNKCKDNKFNVVSYSDKYLYAQRMDKNVEGMVNALGFPVSITNYDDFTCDLSKILVMSETPFTEADMKFLKSMSNEEYHGFESSDNCFEIVHRTVSKSNGIKEVANSYGFDLEDVMVFGDSGNDIDMLSKCGVSVCMGNGTDEAKSVSKYITLTNEEDGLAAFLNKHILYKDLKCVMLDLDGTILNDKKVISEKNKEVLRKLSENGMLIGIATGRPVSTIEKKIKSWQMDDVFSLIVGMNGSLVKNLKTSEFTTVGLIPENAAKEIVEICESENCQVMFADEESIRMSNRSELGDYISKQDEVEFIETDFEYECGQKWPKICIIFNNEEGKKEAQENYNKLTNKDIKGSYGSDISFELINRTVDKGAGIKKACEKLNIDLKDVVAMGDNFNDLEMLQTVGLGVCMANGKDGVKEVSKYVTKYSNNEDGVARFLEQFL